MTATELEQALVAITKQAPALRSAGVVGLIKVGDVEFNLTEPETPQPTGKDDASESDRHALDDPHTYGGSIPERRVRGRELRTDDALERD
jgi:hypothetical protein